MSGPIQNGFQGQVNVQPGVGESGDFYGTNIRAVVLAGPGAFVSPSTQLTVGNFAWADTDTGVASQSFNAAYAVGFVNRQANQAVITAFLAPSTYLINAGFPITLHSQGDFWTAFAAGATPGQNVYADPATGAAIAGATAPVIKSFTGAVALGVLTVTAPSGLPLGVGDVVVGAGVTAGNQITAQLTGSPGVAGTYQLSIADDGISAEAMTVSAVATGFKVNSVAANGELAKISSWG